MAVIDGAGAGYRPRQSSIGGSAGRIGRSVSQRPRPRPQQTRRYNPPPAPLGATSTGRYSAPAPPPSQGAGQVASIKAPPKPPGIGSFLAKDSGYQRQVAQLRQGLKGFEADYWRRRGDVRGESKTSTRALGQQRTQDLENIEADFAARGLQRSGLYGEAVGDYEKEYGERVSDLERRLKQALSQLGGERTQYRSKYKLSKQEAREAAAERRAAKYGL